MPQDQFILETSHLPILLPHEHDAGEAVEDTGHHAYMYSKIFTADKDMWITDMKFEIRNAPDTVVHHANLLNYDEPHGTCKNVPFEQMNQYVQDNMHTPTISFPKGTAMRIKKGQRFQLVVMVHNPLPPIGPGGTYTDVYGRLKLTLVPEDKVAGLKEIKYHLAYLDEMLCKGRLADGSLIYFFTVPPHVKKYAYTGTSDPNDPARFTFKATSTIVYIGGHMHGWQGGTELLVDKNKKPFLSFVTHLSSSYPYRYDSPYYSTTIPINAGDTVSLEAVYDNPNDASVRGVMGMLEMYYYEN